MKKVSQKRTKAPRPKMSRDDLLGDVIRAIRCYQVSPYQGETSDEKFGAALDTFIDELRDLEFFHSDAADNFRSAADELGSLRRRM